MAEFFPRVRRARLVAYPLAALVVLGLGMALRGWILDLDPLVTVEAVTRGVVAPGLWAAVVAFFLLVVVIRNIGGVESDDAGLDRDKLARGAGVVVMIWVASQVLGVLPRVIAEDPVALHRSIEHGSRTRIIATLLVALGTAAVIEVALRGFLLPQLYHRLHRNPANPEDGLGRAIAVTVLVGNLVALPAVLPYITAREAMASQALLAGQGLYLTWLYLRTSNLFFVIGVHTLFIAPTPVVAGPRGEPAWFFPLLAGAIAGVWAMLWPRRDR